MPSRYHLAPLAGYTNLPFRRIAPRTRRPRLGDHRPRQRPGHARKRRARRYELIATTPDDRPLGGADLRPVRAGIPREPRPSGSKPTASASIDINMGCPVRKVVKGGGGSAHDVRHHRQDRRLWCARSSRRCEIPVTVKMRLGWDDDNLIGPVLRPRVRAGRRGRRHHPRPHARPGLRRHRRTSTASAPWSRRSIASRSSATATCAPSPTPARMFDDHRLRTASPSAAGRWRTRGSSGSCSGWEQTGDPGPRGDATTSGSHFMERTFAGWSTGAGEHFGCLQFRKVANWYCRSLADGQRDSTNHDENGHGRDVRTGGRAHPRTRRTGGLVRARRGRAEYPGAGGADFALVGKRIELPRPEGRVCRKKPRKRG